MQNFCTKDLTNESFQTYLQGHAHVWGSNQVLINLKVPLAVNNQVTEQIKQIAKILVEILTTAS